MSMRRGVQQARARGWISTEADLARSVAELDLERPGWDVNARLRGVIRRLERDPSAQGIQAAVDVYGLEWVYKALPCAGLHLMGEVVVAANGQRVYPVQTEPVGDMQVVRGTAVERFTTPDLSEREAQVLHAIAAGRSLKDIARSMGMSMHTIMNVHRAVMSKLDLAARSKAGEEVNASALLQKQAAE
jgi:DNA-binding CsgD family transcriptional regulator